MTIGIILPTFNESESIEDMIKRTRSVNSEFKIYVVDSGSTDGTADIAKKNGAILISLSERGKGLAIKKAFQEINDDLVILLDSDTSYLPEEIPKLLDSLQNCEVVVGSRFRGTIDKGSMKPINRMGNKALSLIAGTLYGKPVSDVCSGFWAFKKSAYKKMNINAKHFDLEVNFYVECVKNNLSLCEVPITYGNRKGQTKLSAMHGFGIGGYLLMKKISQ